MHSYKCIPQLEDGFTRIANEILEAIAQTPLSDYESRCVHFLWRKTYGWQNPNDHQSKKFDVISRTQWAQGTDIRRRHIDEVLKRLVKRKIITKEVIYQGTRRIIFWGFQKRYSEWLSPKFETLDIRLSHKQVTSSIHPSPKEVTDTVSLKEAIDKAKVSPKGVASRVEPSPIEGGLSPEEVTQVSPKQVHTKDNKDTLTKDLPPRDKEILKLLEKLKGWGYKEEEDLAWLWEFTSDYPSFSTTEAKACRDYYSGHTSPKHKGIWKNRFRNWMIKRQEFEKGGKPNERQSKKGVQRKQQRRRAIKYIRGSGENGPEDEENMP